MAGVARLFFAPSGPPGIGNDASLSPTKLVALTAGVAAGVSPAWRISRLQNEIVALNGGTVAIAGAILVAAIG
jgi:hypothetical protein